MGGFGSADGVGSRAVTVKGRVPRYLLLFLLVFLPLWKWSGMRSEVQRRSTFQGWLEDRKGPPAAVAVTVAGACAGGRRCRELPGNLSLGHESLRGIGTSTFCGPGRISWTGLASGPGNKI